MMRVTDQLAIRVDDLSWRFVRAPGPGGQNVNKVATAVELRFDTHSPALPEPVRGIRTVIPSHVSSSGTQASRLRDIGAWFRPRCGGLRHDVLIAYSCKGRGCVCPACNTRRMAETAAHLDHVFPRANNAALCLPYFVMGRTVSFSSALTARNRRTSMCNVSGTWPSCGWSRWRL